MPEPLRKDWMDIGFTVIATLSNPGDGLFFAMDFVAYKHVGQIDPGSSGWNATSGPLFEKRDEMSCLPVETIEESEPYLHGHVIRDGCSNWSFDEQKRCMLHGCDRQDLLNLGEVLARCWDWAEELIMD